MNSVDKENTFLHDAKARFNYVWSLLYALGNVVLMLREHRSVCATACSLYIDVHVWKMVFITVRHVCRDGETTPQCKQRSQTRPLIAFFFSQRVVRSNNPL